MNIYSYVEKYTSQESSYCNGFNDIITFFFENSIFRVRRARNGGFLTDQSYVILLLLLLLLLS